jgi:hypothetical protein
MLCYARTSRSPFKRLQMSLVRSLPGPPTPSCLRETCSLASPFTSLSSAPCPLLSDSSHQLALLAPFKSLGPCSCSSSSQVAAPLSKAHTTPLQGTFTVASAPRECDKARLQHHPSCVPSGANRSPINHLACAWFSMAGDAHCFAAAFTFFHLRLCCTNELQYRQGIKAGDLRWGCGGIDVWNSVAQVMQACP